MFGGLGALPVSTLFSSPLTDVNRGPHLQVLLYNIQNDLHYARLNLGKRF